MSSCALGIVAARYPCLSSLQDKSFSSRSKVSNGSSLSSLLTASSLSLNQRVKSAGGVLTAMGMLAIVAQRYTRYRKSTCARASGTEKEADAVGKKIVRVKVVADHV